VLVVWVWVVSALLPALAGASGIQLSDNCVGDDPTGAKLRAAREAVSQQCSCSATPDHTTYFQCAGRVADAEVNAGHLPSTCKNAVIVCARKTTCGRYAAVGVACCIDVGNHPACRMASSVAACIRMRGTPNTHVPPCTSCCDACPNPGSGPSCSSPSGAFLARAP